VLSEPFGKFVLRLGPLKEKIGEDEYFEICQLNELLLIERNQNGEWEIQSINGGTDGMRSAALSYSFGRWTQKNNEGIGFGALTGFRLSNGAVRAPDFSWLSRKRWDALSENKRKKFAPICPDFVCELRAQHESMADLHNKMEEYTKNGAQLGWLIDPFARTVAIYRPDSPVEVRHNPNSVSGDPLLSGFVLRLEELWSEAA
jgi:Uma2 family endonuclease